tara:strand:+ start:31262 stop:31450 length:189 start_codon:yes stop_codon:yes gene_type:complete
MHLLLIYKPLSGIITLSDKRKSKGLHFAPLFFRIEIKSLSMAQTAICPMAVLPEPEVKKKGI